MPLFPSMAHIPAANTTQTVFAPLTMLCLFYRSALMRLTTTTTALLTTRQRRVKITMAALPDRIGYRTQDRISE